MAADPFSLINRSMARNAGAGYPGGPGGKKGGRRRVDPSDPQGAEYLRRMHPDFDDVMVSASVDYRTRCQTDANFAKKFRIPPVVEPREAFHEHTNSVDAVCWGPEPGKFLSASHDRTLKVWDVQRGRCTETLQGHVGGVYHCSVSPDKRLVVSCGSGEEKNVLLWSWSDKKVCKVLTGHRRAVVHAAFSGDGACAATVDQEGTVIIYDLTRGAPKLQRTIHFGAAHASCFCQEDPNLLCSAGADGFLHLTDIRESCQAQVWRLPSVLANNVSINTTLSIPQAHDGYAVYAVEFPGHTTLFSGGVDHKLKRWDLRALSKWDPVCANQYLGHTAPVRSMALSPGQRYVVTGCEDGSLRVWPADPLSEARASGKQLRAQAKQVAAELQDPSKPGAHIEELARSRQTLLEAAAAARGREERLARDGFSYAARALNGHVARVSACEWQEDASGQEASILSSSWDQRILLFSLRPQELDEN